MEKYNEITKCIKCGNTQATSEFMVILDGFIVKEEVIIRNCANCDFTWHEAPLDAKEDEIN